MTTTDLGGRAARGALSTGVGLIARLVILLITVVVLSRLLTPRDYGLVAMVLAIAGIGDVLRDFGLSSAAIQAPTLSFAQRSNLFWTNTAIGLVLAIGMFALAVPIASFFDEPDLVPIARVMAVAFLLNGMTTQYRADLVRAMRFRVVAVIDVLAPAVALAVAVGLAVADVGYWALVAQQVAQALTALVGFGIVARWVPRWFDRHAPMRKLYVFGGTLLGSQLVGYVANNVDALVIGHRFGATSLGIYNRAFQMLMTPLNQVRAPATTVALPVLSRASTHQAQFDSIVRSGQLVLGYPVAIALAMLVGVAEPTVTIVLGAQWSAVPPVLQLLAIAGIFQTLAYVGYWVYLARGLTRELLQYTFMTAGIRIVCVFVGSAWGVVGVAAGYAIAPALAWPLSLWWLNRSTMLDVRSLYSGAGRILFVGTVAGVASAAAAYALRDESPWWQVVGGGLAGLSAVALVVLPIRPLRRDMLTMRRAGTAALRRPHG